MCLKSWLFVVLYSVDFKKDSSICNKYMNSQIALRVSKYHGVMALLKWEPPASSPTGDRATGSLFSGDRAPTPNLVFFLWAGWVGVLLRHSPNGRVGVHFVFCSGRAGGRRDFVVENRVGVGGRPGTPGPVGGPVAKTYAENSDLPKRAYVLPKNAVIMTFTHIGILNPSASTHTLSKSQYLASCQCAPIQ